MSSKIKALPPVVVKFNILNKVKLIFMAFVSLVLWCAIIVTGISLLSYYIYNVVKNGFFNSESLKYAIIIIVGAYFSLILDKDKIYEALNVKKNLPLITIEQIEDKNK